MNEPIRVKERTIAKEAMRAKAENTEDVARFVKMEIVDVTEVDVLLRGRSRDMLTVRFGDWILRNVADPETGGQSLTDERFQADYYAI